MQLALDLGTINIQNQEIVKFIQHKSIEEIKAPFLNLLTKEVETIQKKPHTWAEFGEKMSGLISTETSKKLSVVVIFQILQMQTSQKQKPIAYL
jgi:hypothetical protein